MSKIPFFFSIDFEDLYHDKKRQLGHLNPGVLEEARWKSYDRIEKLCQKIFIIKGFCNEFI